MPRFLSGFDRSPTPEPKPPPAAPAPPPPTLHKQTLTSLPWHAASGRRFATVVELRQWLASLRG
jgi:hypothetical protein